MLPRQYLNQYISGSKGHTVQVSTRINSLVLKDIQSNEIATQAIYQPGLTPWFKRTHSSMKLLPGNFSTRLNSLVLKDTQSNKIATWQFLNFYNLTRTKSSIFKLMLDSMLNQLAKISSCHVSTRTQTTSKQ